ncbi:MAG: hypothetical protein GWO16_08395 [Gammaproteobacteria bacterium]|nr:hypothetical protein [Gammaproteobacteria bacterium]NIR97968.1 hypothetical protein [Gammaproteobacteria bacterium]NIT63668.1 hypothetical protein [Gammaproteobacteria bacterium]NIV21526.1 hypothetical protein [Gammaproteobacteria bacterium]NIY32248.1 hypothetical protein [Gammaproteobacteria bacterium]
MESQRADGRGHWPAGKARGLELPARLRRRIGRALDTGEWSRAGIGRALRVQGRTVGRWVRRERRIAPELLPLLERLFARRR